MVEKPEDLQPQIEGDVSADVVVVCTGFAGFGARGRNEGYLVGSLGLEYALFFNRGI